MLLNSEFKYIAGFVSSFSRLCDLNKYPQWGNFKIHDGCLILNKPLLNKKKEAAVQRCSVKNVFLEISQNSQENTCARVSFLINLQACNFI